MRLADCVGEWSDTGGDFRVTGDFALGGTLSLWGRLVSGLSNPILAYAAYSASLESDLEAGVETEESPFRCGAECDSAVGLVTKGPPRKLLLVEL